ncbi:MAG: hypothetical protein M3133_06880 [Actinomycetota bacterium]|nr:hypothetical protein [Actinomycetota bacterium]
MVALAALVTVAAVLSACGERDRVNTVTLSELLKAPQIGERIALEGTVVGPVGDLGFILRGPGGSIFVAAPADAAGSRDAVWVRPGQPIRVEGTVGRLTADQALRIANADSRFTRHDRAVPNRARLNQGVAYLKSSELEPASEPG